MAGGPSLQAACRWIPPGRVIRKSNHKSEMARIRLRGLEAFMRWVVVQSSATTENPKRRRGFVGWSPIGQSHRTEKLKRDLVARGEELLK
jgi:hypothetical protein